MTTINLKRSIIIFTLFALTGMICADITKAREWTFQDSSVVTLSFVNAYGDTAYFYNEDEPVNTKIYNLAEHEQAEIILWSRERDRETCASDRELTEFTRKFREDSKVLEGDKLVDRDWSEVSEPDFYVIYTSASWCPPCKKFTPILVSTYNLNKGIYKDRFELVLCSWDKSKRAMIKYMKDENMPWLANWRKARKGSFNYLCGQGKVLRVIITS